MLNGGVDLLRSLGSIKIKALSIYIFTKVIVRPGLKHDLNKSTRSARRYQNNLPIQTGPDPFLGWALILQAITPSAKKEVWPRETSVSIFIQEHARALKIP